MHASIDLSGRWLPLALMHRQQVLVTPIEAVYAYSVRPQMHSRLFARRRQHELSHLQTYVLGAGGKG
jgi:hypothetical protein